MCARTRAIAVVHYAGVACEMDAILELARKHDLLVVEDAAQALGSLLAASLADASGAALERRRQALSMQPI